MDNLPEGDTATTNGCLQLGVVLLLSITYAVFAVVMAVATVSLGFFIDQRGTRTPALLMLIGIGALDLLSALPIILWTNRTLGGYLSFGGFVVRAIVALVLFLTIQLILGFFSIMAVGEMQP